MRTSTDQLKNGLLFNGYDYLNQAWVKNGRYVRCGHPDSMICNCYGRLNEGRAVTDDLGFSSEASYRSAVVGDNQ